jgi:hypothetical protein
MMASDTSLAPDAPLWWNAGDPVRTRFFDALSLLLPAGEQFLIDTAADWLRASESAGATPSGLAAEVRRFIAEETAHQRAHRLYNDRLARHSPARHLEQRIEEALGPIRQSDLSTRIALGAAFEQLTALLSAEFLREGDVWLGDGHSLQGRLWRWHCQEELDHCHVTADVMRAAGIGWCRRAAAMALSLLFIGSDVLVSVAGLCRSDRQAGRCGAKAQALGAAAFALRAIPGVMRIAAGAIRYMLLGPYRP